MQPDGMQHARHYRVGTQKILQENGIRSWMGRSGQCYPLFHFLCTILHPHPVVRSVAWWSWERKRERGERERGPNKELKLTTHEARRSTLPQGGPTGFTPEIKLFCMRSVFLFSVGHLSNTIHKSLISGVKSWWTILYMVSTARHLTLN